VLPRRRYSPAADEISTHPRSESRMSSDKIECRKQSLEMQVSVAFDESSHNPALHSCCSLAPTKSMSSKLFRATYKHGAYFHLIYETSSCRDAESVRQTEGEHTR